MHLFPARGMVRPLRFGQAGCWRHPKFGGTLMDRFDPYRPGGRLCGWSYESRNKALADLGFSSYREYLASELWIR